MMLVIIFSMMMSSILLINTHPVLMVITIIMQALFICLIMWLINSTAWLSYIMFLIFIGGLMVLFIYITSLASNEKFEMNSKSMMTKPPIMALTAILVAVNFITQAPSLSNQTSNNNLILMILTNPIMMITLFLMTYLLIALIVVVKISSKKEAPLRAMIKK